jgi:type I restriction enzyme, S subunit
LEKAREGLADYRRSILKAAVTGELTREWREKNTPNETGADLLKRILAERRAAWERAELAKRESKGEKPTNHAWKARYPEPIAPDAANLPELPCDWAWATLDQLSSLITSGSRAGHSTTRMMERNLSEHRTSSTIALT